MSLETLWAMLGGHTGYHVLELGSFEDKRVDLWSDVTNRARFVRLCRHHSWASDLTVSARPYAELGSRRLFGLSGCVWVHVVSGKQFAALERFPVEPTMILRAGGSVMHWAFWGLNKPLRDDDGEKVNKHLAHRFGCAKKNAAQMFFPPPGAVLRQGRSKALPITCVGGTMEPHSVGRVCATLPKKIPDTELWRKAREA